VGETTWKIGTFRGGMCMCHEAWPGMAYENVCLTFFGCLLHEQVRH
jgi:hypothetical protein